jgi:hypothetical protein
MYDNDIFVLLHNNQPWLNAFLAEWGVMSMMMMMMTTMMTTTTTTMTSTGTTMTATKTTMITSFILRNNQP